MAAAITLSAYTNAINGKQYGVAAALAIAGAGLTLIASTATLFAVNAAASAQPALAELQDRVARKLKIDSIRMARSQAGIRQRRGLIIVMFGTATLLDIAGLLYAVIR